MQDIFEIIYHYISGCTYLIKTGVYYLAQVPEHLSNFVSSVQRFINVIPSPWSSVLGFGLVSSIAIAFISIRRGSA